jgi:hypothetical protein
MKQEEQRLARREPVDTDVQKLPTASPARVKARPVIPTFLNIPSHVRCETGVKHCGAKNLLILTVFRHPVNNIAPFTGIFYRARYRVFMYFYMVQAPTRRVTKA